MTGDVVLRKNPGLWSAAVAVCCAVLFSLTVILPMHNELKRVRLKTERLRLERKWIEDVTRNHLDKVGFAGAVPLKDVPALLDEISSRAEELGVGIASLVRQDKARASSRQSQSLPIFLETVSDYQAAARFISSLRSLKKGIVLVDEFHVVQDELQPELVRVKLHLQVLLKGELRGKK